MAATMTTSDAQQNSLISTICAFIFVGASLNFIASFTYLRKRRRKSTHIFPMCLALVDLFNCLNLSMAVVRLLGVSREFENIACTVQPYLSYCGNIISGSLVICIAFERCRKVSEPFRITARGNYWIAVLSTIMAGSLISFTIALYRAFGFNKTCIPEDGRVLKDNDFDGVIQDLELLIPLTFLVFVFICFFIGFIFMIVRYTKLTKLIICKASLRQRLSSTLEIPLERDNSVLTDDEKISHAETNSSSESSENSSTCLAPDNNVAESRNVTFPSYKVKQPSVFTIFPDEYYRKLSQVVLVNSPENVNRQHFRIDREKQTGTIRRRASTLSIAARSRSRSPRKTIVMLVFSVVSFLFYFPYLCLSFINLIKPSVKDSLSHEAHFVYGVFEHSYMLAFVVNPILYTFFNHGFKTDFNRAFGCSDTCGRNDRTTSSFISARNSFSVPSKNRIKCHSRTNTRTEETSSKIYPFIKELEKRNKCVGIKVETF